MLLLGMAPWAVGILIVLFLAVCVLMILTVLIQKPQGGGLSGAFGAGASSGQTAFGAKTGDALTMFTIFVFVLFLVLAIFLNFVTKPQAITDPTSAVIPGETQTPEPAPVPPATGTEPLPGTGATPPATDTTPAPTPAPAPAPTPESPAPTAPPEPPAPGGGR